MAAAGRGEVNSVLLHKHCAHVQCRLIPHNGALGVGAEIAQTSMDVEAAAGNVGEAKACRAVDADIEPTAATT
jgi:hypothetical protein